MKNKIDPFGFKALDKLFNIKKVTSLEQAYRFNLFPTYKELLALDTYFSTYMNYFDLYGKPQPRRINSVLRQLSEFHNVIKKNSTEQKLERTALFRRNEPSNNLFGHVSLDLKLILNKDPLKKKKSGA